MKIAFVITRSDTIGGAHVHVLDLACAYMQEGHQVVVMVGGNGPFADLLRSRGVLVCNLRWLVRPIRPYADLLALIELMVELRRIRPDLVHAHSAKAGLLGRIAAKLARFPAVFTAHGWSFTEGIAERSRRFSMILERLVGRLSKSIICVSDYDYRLALDCGVVDPGSLVRIHNGVPDVESGLRALPGSAGTLRIVSVARLDVPKDHALLLNALGYLRDLPWQLELIGDGPLTDQTKAQAAALGIADRVLFSGLCKDVPQRLSAAHLFVLVSEWEGLPLSILEAMRAGLPVLASDVGGVSEAVQDGLTGCLVPRGDKEALVRGLRDLLSDSAKRVRMGRAGRSTFEQEFTFELMKGRTLAVYERLLLGREKI